MFRVRDSDGHLLWRWPLRDTFSCVTLLAQFLSQNEIKVINLTDEEENGDDVAAAEQVNSEAQPAAGQDVFEGADEPEIMVEDVLNLSDGSLVVDDEIMGQPLHESTTYSQSQAEVLIVPVNKFTNRKDKDSGFVDSSVSPIMYSM